MMFSHKHNKIRDSELYKAYRIFFGTLVSSSRLKINQTAVSHDLARLKKCGFVSVETDGKFRYYKLNEKTIKPLIELIEKHMSQFCVHILKNKDIRR